MPSTTIEYTKAAQDKTLEAIKQGQSVIVEAVAAWAKATEKAIPATPALPVLPGVADLPTPDELVKTSFDFYGDVLAAQRKFATDLIAAAAPVLKAAKHATKPAA
jgi:hypothetical protein